MRKIIKIFVLLLSLMLVLSYAGAAPIAVYADDAPDDSVAVAWLVSTKDAEGTELQFTSSEEIADALGGGFSLDGGLDGASPATVADLRDKGVKITPPKGYALGSVMLVAEGSSPDEDSRSLLLLSKPALDGSGAFTFDAKIFAEDFDASAVGCVFNGSGSTYILRIALERVDSSEPITLTYTAGALADSLGDTALVAGGNTVSLWLDEESMTASGTFSSLESSAADEALNTFGKQFTGWKLTLPCGASAVVNGGDAFALSASATLEAQWKDVIVFRFTGGEKLYDGTPLTGSYTRSGELKSGDSLEIPDDAFTLSRTDAGESEATVDLSRVRILRDGTDVTDEYDFVLIPASLRVVKRGLTFSVADAEKEYDGTALGPSSCTKESGELVDGHTYSVSYSGQQTVPGSGIGSATVTISDADGRNVTDNYEISVVNGSIIVRPRSDRQPVTVTIADLQKEYDGSSELPAVSFSVTDGSLLGGDTLSAGAFTASIFEVGTGSIGGSFSVLNGETDVSENYAVTVVPGKLTVRARALALTADSAEKEYDGEPLTKDSFTVSSGSLVSGHELTASVIGSQTEPGSSPNKIDAASVKIMDGENDVTAQYDIRLVDGTLTVNGTAEPIALTITMKSAEKEYDGKALTSSDYEISSGSLESGDELVLGEVTGKQTNVGVSSVTASFTVRNGQTDVSSKYAITVVPGRLTVKSRALVLTADSAEKVYDGKPLTKDSFTISSGSLVSGHKLTATVKGSQTDPGSSPNKIDAASVKVMDGEKDLSAQYSIRLVDGTLTVKDAPAPIALTITMKSAEKVYDGKALSSKDYEISSGSLESGDKLVLGEVTGEQTDAGESTVTASFTVKHGKTDVTSKYAITVVPGKLTVKQREITITADSASKIYDGRPLTRDSFKLTSGELVKGHKLSASVSGSQTQPGSSANVIVKSSIKITDGSGRDVAKNYNVTTAAGTLSVGNDPITSITLSVGDFSKVYDGKPYRFLSSDIKVTSGTLPSGYRIEATFNPEAPVDAGKYDITIKSVTIRNASGADVTSQFNITRARGTLTITQRPLLIETKAANKVYDGTPLTERSTPNITGRVEGHQVTLRITGSQTKVGSSENTVSDVKITDKETGVDVTKNYEISYKFGMLTVTEASGDDASSYTWVSGSAGTLFVKFSHAYDGFEGLQVDGKDLDRGSYSSASGSTEIWLKASYLNTLSPGTHTLKAKYAGGETVQASILVKSSSPTRTGDNSQLGLWIAILAAALIAVFVAGWYLFLGKDRRWKKKNVKRSR